MKVLLIDDMRSMGYVKTTYGIEVTHVARTFAEGINKLKSGTFDLLLLDHDLASYDDEGNELTGYKVMLFLEENPEYLPKQIMLVTSNPVGRAKMQTVIDKLYKK
jgi:CheY-like chemotaxis protein